MSKLRVTRINVVSRNYVQKLREVSKSRFENDDIEIEVAERSEKIQMLISFEGKETFDLSIREICDLVIKTLR